MGDTVLGPIDYLAVERPESRVTGEGFRRLMDLVDRGVVRLLDILFIGKDPDGHVSKVEVADVEHSDALDERLWGLSSGLLDESDIDQVAAAIEPGSLAGILVYENVWRCRCGRRSTRAAHGLSARDASSPTIWSRRLTRSIRREHLLNGDRHGTVEDRVESGRGGEDG